jgi:hypothetical protein
MRYVAVGTPANAGGRGGRRRSRAGDYRFTDCADAGRVQLCRLSGSERAISAIRHRSEHAGIERDRAMRIHDEREGCADGGLPDWARGNGIGHPMRYHNREISRTNPLISAALWLNCGCAVRAFPRMSSVEPRTSNLERRSSRLDAHVSTLSRSSISSVHRRSSSRNRCPRAMSPWLAVNILLEGPQTRPRRRKWAARSWLGLRTWTVSGWPAG